MSFLPTATVGFYRNSTKNETSPEQKLMNLLVMSIDDTLAGLLWYHPLDGLLAVEPH